MSENQDSRFEQLEGLEDSYDQIQKIAIGGMAEVYRGRQKNLDRPVAIKRIKAEYRDSPDLQKRFEREARSAANLLHHNLAHVYDYKVVGKESYIIMEYIDGFDLAQIQEKVGELPVDVATMVAVKVLQGLVQVHSHGMIHRDIKPDNIRVTTRGEVKIMDFGIALDPGEENLTQPGILIGSPHYLAPEQILGERLDSQADLFAFGITFYEMLCNKRPFYERDGETVYTVIKSGKFDPIESFRKDVPAFIRNIIERCLRVKVSDRPRSAEAVVQILEEYLIAEHSLSFEARIRQFLMESKLMGGDPRLIDVGEKTDAQLPGQKWPYLERKYLWVWLLGLLLVLGSFYFLGSSSSLEGDVGAEATEKSQKEKPKSSLPGMPVDD